MSFLNSLQNEAKFTFDALYDRTSSLFKPTLRLGVTGLSRAGKTIFITALIQHLMESKRLTLFQAARENRIIHINIEHQPDDTIARFEFEKNLNTIVQKREWPQSTRNLSEIRITFTYEARSGLRGYFKKHELSVDLIDYPGEWLLDLPLLDKSYRTFSTEAIERAQLPAHRDHSKDWLKSVMNIDARSGADEMMAQQLAKGYTHYLKQAKQDPRILSMLPPGRFLMPGEYEGSPALTFCPLPFLADKCTASKGLEAMMERRYESYKKKIVAPFFREHIARLDRQIILIDAMQSLNSGAEAIHDLQSSLADILSCFRKGQDHWIGNIFRHRISKILVAATKADHVHHLNHNRLQSLTKELVNNAINQADLAGTKVESLAIASIRSTYEAQAQSEGEELPVIVGTPIKGEKINGQLFDGEVETAVFPGDLPATLEDSINASQQQYLRFIRFRPPINQHSKLLPHIRLDRAIQFLLGDKLT